MNNKLKSYYPHLIALGIIFVIGCVFFSPVLQGLRLVQGDMRNTVGILQEANFYNKLTASNTLWSGNAFSGMPTFVTTASYEGNLVSKLGFLFFGGHSPLAIWLLYALSFYLLMSVLKVRQSLAVVGALAFAFSSYFIVILEVGHVTKALAVAFAPAILAGLILVYRGKYFIGAALLSFAMALEIYSNHIQVSYYFAFIFLFYVVAQFIEAFQNKSWANFIKASTFSLLAVVIGVLCNYASIYNTYDYGKQTTRGTTELTIKADGSSNKDIATSGLDRDYVTAWSYGLQESWTLLIPNAKGGSTGAIGGDNKALDKADPALRENVAQSNQYWGDQSFTEGPVYLGAGVCLLFILGMVFLEGYLKWVMLAGAVLSLSLSWGKNFMGLTDFFLDHVPGYNKFRAVTIILVVLELCVPVVAILFVNELIEKREQWLAKKKLMLYLGGGFSALLLLFWLSPDSFFTFINQQEAEGLSQQAIKSPEMASQIQLYIDSLKNVRIAIFKADAARSLFLVIATFALIYAFLVKNFKSTILVVSLGVLFVGDLFTVNRRYLSTEKQNGRYVQWEEAKNNDYPYQPSTIDMEILSRELSGGSASLFANSQDVIKEINEKIQARKAEKRAKGLSNSNVEDGELASIQFGVLGLNSNYRVLNLTVSPFNDASTSNFHKSIGGYHGAKLKRYQELIEFHLSNPINPEVLNMLNTKYIITQNGLQQNPQALGNAWFVGKVKSVKNADEEITALKNFKPAETAIVDQRYAKLVKELPLDSSATIRQTAYKPNKLTYESNSSKEQLAIFSEIYYPGWQATIDGKPVDHFRCDYVLRGLVIPAGKHKIEFVFEPESVKKSEMVSYAGSAGLVLLLLVGLFGLWKERKQTA